MGPGQQQQPRCQTVSRGAGQRCEYKGFCGVSGASETSRKLRPESACPPSARPERAWKHSAHAALRTSPFLPPSKQPSDTAKPCHSPMVAPAAAPPSSSPSILPHLMPCTFLTSLTSILGAKTRCELCCTSIGCAKGSKSKTTSEPVGSLTLSESCAKSSWG